MPEPVQMTPRDLKAAQEAAAIAAVTAPAVQINIVMMADGRIGVNGNIDNQVIALGMLETAKNVIVRYCESKAADSKIIT